MAEEKNNTRKTKSAGATRPPKIRPNRIYELTQARNWTYADVAERVRNHAAACGDTSRMKVHELTINRLATGVITLTQPWMETLGAVYGVPLTEIIAAPSVAHMRLIKVTIALEAGVWKSDHTLPVPQQFEIMVPDDDRLRGVPLYAAEIRGPASNLRYSEHSIAIISKITPNPGEVIEGRRYHVRVTRENKTTEETIKLLVMDGEKRFWLKPESNHPEHQAWFPLEGRAGETVELLGRVRGVYFRED
jgi:hypothetical protein